MRKKIRFWTGAAFGAAVQYFYDPKAGQARRAQLRQRVTDRLGDAKDGLVRKDGPISDGRVSNGNPASRIDHLRLWRMEPRRTASRIV